MYAKAQPSPSQPSPQPSPAQPTQGVWALGPRFWRPAKPSLAQPRPAQPTTQARSAQPSSQTASPVQPGQHRSGQARPQPSPAQPKPWCGPCQSSAKGFFLPDSEVPFSAAGALRFCSVFGRFGAAVPLRFAVLEPRLWGLVFGASPAQASEPSPASPAQPKPWCGPCQSSAKAFSYRIQMSHFDRWEKRNRQGTQPSLSPAHKPQAQPSQASTGQARPGHSRAQPSPSRGVGLAKAVPKAFSYRIQIKPSLAQPRPAQPTTQARSAQPKPSSQTASPVQPGQHRSGQARPQPSPAQPSPSRGVGLAKALPKAFSYRIQRCHSRPPERSVFAPFLAGLGPPCRCVSPF